MAKKILSASMKKAKSLQKQVDSAKKNTTVVKKVAREEPELIKAGTPKDHSLKHDPQEPAKSRSSVVGASLGVTLNMDNYESVRIDCWLTDEVNENETKEEAFARVLAVVEKQVHEVASNYKINM